MRKKILNTSIGLLVAITLFMIGAPVLAIDPGGGNDVVTITQTANTASPAAATHVDSVAVIKNVSTITAQNTDFTVGAGIRQDQAINGRTGITPTLNTGTAVTLANGLTFMDVSGAAATSRAGLARDGVMVANLTPNITATAAAFATTINETNPTTQVQTTSEFTKMLNETAPPPLAGTTGSLVDTANAPPAHHLVQINIPFVASAPDDSAIIAT